MHLAVLLFSCGRKSQPLLLVLDDLFTNSGRRRLDLAVDIELSSHTTAHERCLLCRSSLCHRAAHPMISRPSVEGFPASLLLAPPGSRAILCGATDHFRMHGVWCTGLRQSEPCQGPRPLVDKASHSRPAPGSARAFGPSLCAHCGHATFGRPSGGRERPPLGRLFCLLPARKSNICSRSMEKE